MVGPALAAVPSRRTCDFTTGPQQRPVSAAFSCHHPLYVLGSSCPCPLCPPFFTLLSPPALPRLHRHPPESSFPSFSSAFCKAVWAQPRWARRHAVHCCGNLNLSGLSAFIRAIRGNIFHFFAHRFALPCDLPLALRRSAPEIPARLRPPLINRAKKFHRATRSLLTRPCPPQLQRRAMPLVHPHKRPDAHKVRQPLRVLPQSRPIGSRHRHIILRRRKAAHAATEAIGWRGHDTTSQQAGERTGGGTRRASCPLHFLTQAGFRPPASFMRL
jgi:hypothetical protein